MTGAVPPVSSAKDYWLNNEPGVDFDSDREAGAGGEDPVGTGGVDVAESLEEDTAPPTKLGSGGSFVGTSW
jgi:hypothetical protein